MLRHQFLRRFRWLYQSTQVGIPSRISVQPSEFSADAITHMGYFIPVNRAYKLLEENGFEFIYDSNFTLEECLKAKDDDEDDTE